jgi:O-antigen/teichoic acid export membrane protein
MKLPGSEEDLVCNSSERKVLIRSVVLGYVNQVASIVIGLISVPLLLNYFDKEQYGIWTLITGLVGYLALTNFGIPTAASVLIAKLANGYEKYLILVKSLKLLIMVTAVTFVLISLLILIFPGWIKLLGVISLKNTEPTHIVVLVMGVGVLLRTSLSLALSAFSGFQRVDIVKAYELLTILVTFAALCWTIYAKEDLVFLALITSGSSLIVGIISFIHFSYKYRNIRNKQDVVEDHVSTRVIIASSFSFFQIGAAATLVWSTDNLIISNMINVEAVAPYAIAFRLFSMGFILFTLINGLLIPLYGNAMVNNEWRRMQKIFVLQTNILPVIAGAVWIVGLILSKEVIELWTGRTDMFGGYLLVFSLGGYGYILSFVNIYGGIMTAMNYSTSISRVAWLEAVLNIVFSVALVKILGIGGAALGTMLAAFLCPFILLPKYLSKLSDSRTGFNLKRSHCQFYFSVFPCLTVSMLFVYFIDNSNYRLIFAIVVLLFYILISWKLLPSEASAFILQLGKRRIKAIQ